MLSEVVSRNHRHLEYWQRPETQWSVSTWDKYLFQKTGTKKRQMSRSALILEVEILIEHLDPKSREHIKALALKRQLKVSIFTRS